ncbi:MAG: elongation factor P [Candidatus Uhrbacteria bacterium]|nr:elongation factor P [Patescibacteria group bacterium]MBU1907165.1 elongation factor P [Patescibacteria group bacterium]
MKTIQPFNHLTIVFSDFMPSPNEIKKGTIIKQNGILFVVTDFQRVSPGKGSSFVRTKLKNLQTGKVQDVVFKSAETLEFEDVAFKTMQYLFNDGSIATFMDTVSYEQVEVPMDAIGDEVKYLKEGLEVKVAMHGDVPITVELPRKITYEVKSAPPAVKGDTASGNVTKEVELDNGMKAQVPIFIKVGDNIVINPETGDYVERAN